jgi:hypothetical protein
MESLHDERAAGETRRPREVRAALGGVLLLLAVLAGVVAVRAWLGLNDSEPLLAGLPAGGSREAEAPPPRMVRRAVLVIADGLTLEAAAGLPVLARIRSAGVTATASAAGPTFSTPSYATWLSGLDPVDSGVRTNRYQGPLRLDSVLARARAAGLRTLGYDGGPSPVLSTLFGPHLRRHLSGREAWGQVLAAIPEVDLAVLGITEVDAAGHRRGAGDPSYDEAARIVDGKLGEVEKILDLRRDVLIVVSDHGHLRRGGHGGIEDPVRTLFLAGAGAVFARGRRATMDPKDLAPTLSALLGLQPPSHNRGWSLGWALTPEIEEPRFWEASFAAQYRARYRVEHYLGEELGAVLQLGRQPRPRDVVRATLGNLEEARRLGWHTLQTMQLQVDAARQAYRDRLRRVRASWIGGVLAVCLVLLVVAGRLRWIRVGALGWLLALLPAPLVAGALFLLDLRPTLSFSGTPERWLTLVGGAAAGAALLHGLLAMIGGRDERGDALAGRILAGAFVASAIAGAAHVIMVTAAGAALPDLRLLAGALIAAFGWPIHLALAGILLLLAALRRRIGEP